MVARNNAAVVFRRLRTLLSREDWIYVLGLFLPLAIYDAALKTTRVAGLLGTPGLLEFADQVRSELLFGLGYVALWVGVFAVARRGLPRLFALVLLHLTVVVDVALTTSAHYFYEATGSVLGYDLVAFSLSTWRETQVVAVSETTTGRWLLLSAALFYAIAGPAILTRVLGPRWHVPTASPGAARFTSVAVVLAAAVAFGALSLLPSATGASKSFARDPLVNMFVTEFGKLGSKGAEIETELVAEGSPKDATLAKTPETAERNVVMIFLESTRASATTPYNEGLETTPFLAGLAEYSLLVEDAYAVVPHTSKALVAGHCGVAPPLDTNNSEADPGDIPARCLPDLLKEQGYATAFFQSATEDFERRRMLVENLGHENFFPAEGMPKEGFEQANYFGYEDDVMLGPSKEWLEEQQEAGTPFMVSYLTVTPHHDYGVPQRYGEEEFVARDEGDAEDEKLNNYLNTVRYQDYFLQNLFRQYAELGLYEDTIFVILGDHGEGFGEHDRWQHDSVIYEEGLRVPLIVHDPKRFASAPHVEGPANQLDLLPTLTGLLGYDIANGVYPGSPLYALPEDRLVMASCYQERTCMASIRGKEKYVYHFGDQDAEFFDLANDPREKTNLIADEEPARIEELREALLAWRLKVNTLYEE